MQIIINKYGEIIAFASDGTYIKGITVDIPSNVLADNPLSYKYKDFKFVKNAEYSGTPRLDTEEIQYVLLSAEVQGEIKELKTTQEVLSDMFVALSLSALTE